MCARSPRRSDPRTCAALVAASLQVAGSMAARANPFRGFSSAPSAAGASLGAIRDEVLVPDVVAYAVQCAIDAFTEAMQKEDPRQVRARLREIDKELANLARFAAKTGKVDAAAAQYAELDAEHSRPLDRLTEIPAFDPEEIRRAAERPGGGAASSARTRPRVPRCAALAPL